MSWSCGTDPDCQTQLHRVAEFVETEVAPLDLVFESPEAALAKFAHFLNLEVGNL